MFQAQSQSALSQQDVNVSSLKACWDALYPEKGNSGYLTLVTSSFPVAKVTFLLAGWSVQWVKYRSVN